MASSYIAFSVVEFRLVPTSRTPWTSCMSMRCPGSGIGLGGGRGFEDPAGGHSNQVRGNFSCICSFPGGREFQHRARRHRIQIYG